MEALELRMMRLNLRTAALPTIKFNFDSLTYQSVRGKSPSSESFKNQFSILLWVFLTNPWPKSAHNVSAANYTTYLILSFILFLN